MIRTIFLERPPLVPLRRSGLNIGNVRTANPGVRALYGRINMHLNAPEMWQGAFELACMLTVDPLREAVTGMILQAVERGENASFPGSFTDQLYTARAALSLAEYTADKDLLKRLAEWCRWIEVNWDQVIALERVRVQPADFMEFLIRFYLMTGAKAALRLCARLRSGAMDWATALHSYGTVGRLKDNVLTDDPQVILDSPDLDETDYQKRLCILNHGEMLADGMRYTAFSGLFSGNGQELSAGERGWRFIRKSDGAACGGTCGAPFLCGRSSHQPVSAEVLAAWMEAFGAQLLVSEGTWPLDEMIRIGFNGLRDALRENSLQMVQYLNQLEIGTDIRENSREEHVLARCARAVSAFYRWAAGLSAGTLHLHYPLAGKYLIPGKKAVVTMNSHAAEIRVRDTSELGLAVYAAATETREMLVCHGKQEITVHSSGEPLSEIREGKLYQTETKIHDQDRIEWKNRQAVRFERVHHQGLCFWAENQIRVLKTDQEWRYAATGNALCTEEGAVQVEAAPVSSWRVRDHRPVEIPVLPARAGEPLLLQTTPYAGTDGRIAIFPRAAAE